MEFIWVIIQQIISALQWLFNLVIAIANFLWQGLLFLWQGLVFVFSRLIEVFIRLGQFFQALWNGIVKFVIQPIVNVIRFLREHLERFFRPLIRFILKVRQILDDFFFKYIAPILNVIQILRKVLLFFRLLGFSFAVKLDARLLKLETNIAGFFIQIRGYLNQLVNILNTIIDVDSLLTGPVLLGSVGKYIGAILAIFYTSQQSPIDQAETNLRRQRFGEIPAELIEDARQALQNP